MLQEVVDFINGLKRLATVLIVSLSRSLAIVLMIMETIKATRVLKV